MAQNELELVVFSGDSLKYETTMMKAALASCEASPGEDWRPRFSQQGVEEELRLLAEKHRRGYSGKEKREQEPRGIRFWNMTDAPLRCEVIDSDTGESLNAPLMVGPYEPSGQQGFHAERCSWTDAQLSAPFTMYTLSVEGLPPTDYYVNGESSQQVVVRLAEKRPVAPAPAAAPAPAEGLPPNPPPYQQAPAPAPDGSMDAARRLVDSFVDHFQVAYSDLFMQYARDALQRVPDSGEKLQLNHMYEEYLDHERRGRGDVPAPAPPPSAPPGPRGLAELGRLVDFGLPADCEDPLKHDSHEEAAKAKYPEFFAKGGRVIEAPDQETVMEWVKGGKKPWSVGIHPTDFLIPVCHQGMNRSQVMRLVLTGVSQQLRGAGPTGCSEDTEWVSRAHGAVSGCDAHSAWERGTLTEENFITYMFDTGEIFEEDYSPARDTDAQSGPLQRGFVELFQVGKKPRIGEEMARGRKLNPTTEYVSPREWLEIGEAREYTHRWFNTFMFAPMERIREAAATAAHERDTPRADQNTLPPPAARRRIFFAFARAVPNLIDRLLEVEHGALNTVIVSLQYDDIMNSELRHCARMSEQQVLDKMVEVHQKAYLMYAKLVHADSTEAPPPAVVPAPVPAPEIPAPGVAAAAADPAAALKGLVSQGYDPVMADFLAAELATGVYRKTTAKSDHLFPKVYEGANLVYEPGDFVMMLNEHEPRETGGVLHFQAESLFGPRGGKSGFVPFTHMVELEDRDKVALAFAVQDLEERELRKWNKAAQKFASKRRRAEGGGGARQVQAPAPAPGPGPVAARGGQYGGAGPAAARGGQYGGAAITAHDRQAFITWATGSGQMAEQAARELLERAIQEGQLPPFEGAKNIVREARSAKLRAAESEGQRPAEPQRDAMARAPSNRVGGGAAATQPQHLRARVGYRGEPGGPGEFLAIKDPAGVSLGRVAIPAAAYPNDEIELVVSFDEVRGPRILQMSYGLVGTRGVPVANPVLHPDPTAMPPAGMPRGR